MDTACSHIAILLYHKYCILYKMPTYIYILATVYNGQWNVS